MTPTLIAILLVCVLVVLFAPVLWSFAVPLGRALWRRYFLFEWPSLLSTLADEDGSQPVRSPAEPAEPAAVRAHQNQLEPAEPDQIEPEREPSEVTINNRMGRTELIALLAVQRKDDGGYVFSSNQITAFVGGTAAEVKAQIAAIRNPPKPETPAQIERGKSLRRPAEGW